MKIFETTAAMKLAHLTAGQLVERKGYYAAGDGGQARFLIKTAVDYAATPDEYGDHTLANGNVAVLQKIGPISVYDFGGLPSQLATVQEAAFSAAETASPNESIYVPYNTYDLNSGTLTGKFHSYGTPVFTTGTITVLNLNV